MDAVILAAGRGNRLKELTVDKPKCMVQVNGRAIIDYQLDALLQNRVDRIVIVVGFAADKLRAHVRALHSQPDRIVFVENTEYDQTDNMYSLYLARHFVRGNEFLLLNADVVFDSSIVSSLVEEPGNAVCVDVGSYAEESMKVTLADDGRSIGSIAKTVAESAALGSSIDIYRFDADGGRSLFDEIVETVEKRHVRGEWTEAAIDRLVASRRLAMTAYDISGRDWAEIDDLRDLQHCEILFGRRQFDWRYIKLAFVDMDGTLYRGTQGVAGAGDFIAELRRRVPHVYFLSNNSSLSSEHHARRLGAIGVEARPAEILLSSDALAVHLQSRRLNKVFVVGTASLKEVLAAGGIHHTADDPQAVVLGYDTELTYEKLSTASLLLQNPKLPYLATHRDVVCPTERGDVPDIGSLMALIKSAVGRDPDLVFGKPDRQMVAHVYEETGVESRDSVFIGDRIYTDYEMAGNCGARFVGVLTGEATRADFEACKPTAIFPSVAEIFNGLAPAPNS